MPLLTHTVTLFSVYHLLLAISNIIRCNSLILFKLYGWLISVHLSYSEIRLPVALSRVSFCRASWHLVVILWHCTKIIKLFALTTLNFYFRLSNSCLSAWNKNTQDFSAQQTAGARSALKSCQMCWMCFPVICIFEVLLKNYISIMWLIFVFNQLTNSERKTETTIHFYPLHKKISSLLYYT